MGTGSYKDILLTSDGLQTDFVKLNGKSVKVVISRNCLISHIGMEILAKKEACGILQLIRDLHFIGKLRKRASNKYNPDWEQNILNEDKKEIQISCSLSWETRFPKECVNCFLQHWRGPLKWWAFYCFCGKENGGDKRDNLNWQMAFLNREKVISSSEFGRWNRVDGGGEGM